MVKTKVYIMLHHGPRTTVLFATTDRDLAEETRDRSLRPESSVVISMHEVELELPEEIKTP